ncbi:flavoprotein [Streptomyces sp. NPDC054950]
MEQTSRKPLILVCATGAASVLTLPSYLVTLQSRLECEVKLAMSSAATQFISASSLSHMVDDVIDESDREQAFKIGHMRLALEADAIVVLPASANTLSCAALGLANSLVSSIVLASPHPVLFLPSMNRLMWEKPVLQRNVASLRNDGHEVPEPVYRRGFELADRTFGEHPTLPTPGELLDLVTTLLSKRFPDGSLALS